ncbi:probable polyamine transporter At3g19553 [Cornus florida]|uniref:probable polyamine transporter At3g19553 n=1 Tax=Cornus florida TaxID=4283 RepID=UPI0028982B63|nr:probable polyamine transporter At3g19553 [Cornus florida]XP_059652988.1 probable polyamine transporter At3g19553 [Cornus florida]
MGETEEGMVSKVKNDATKSNPKLTVLPLIALIFYEVSGGPFGVEDSVRAGGGPLLSLLGFLIFPLFWSIPEALITAELATSFPENGGYVIWISSAFGPFWGFQEGFWKWFSGVMDNALYPVLFLDYLKHSFPIFNRLVARIPALLGITVSLTYLNYRGLHIVGFSAVLLAVFSLCPFVVMALLSIPRIRPQRWLVVDFRKVNWRGYFNSMFWNLNYWDKASTLAGEIENPSRTFPKALLGAVVVVVSSYLIPLLAGTGALKSDPSEWSDGYFAEVGMLIGGFWLKWWIQAAAAMSNLGLFEAEMSGDAFQLLGMSEMGMLPAIFASRSKYGTPTISILFSATGVIFLSWMSFQEILEFLNFLYSIGMLLEFAAFVKLRIKKPDLHRPYKVPLQTFGATMLCLPPALLLILVMCLASLQTYLVSGAVIILGVFLYPTVVHAKDRKWIHFNTEQPAGPSDTDPEGDPILSEQHQEVNDEASVSLLSGQSSSVTEQTAEVSLEEVLKLE